MKTRTIVILAALALLAYSMTGCITTETTLPDGTVIRQTGPAEGSQETTAILAGAVAHRIRAEK